MVTSELKQNGRHFAGNDFKCILSNESIHVLIQIPTQFVPKGAIDSKSLVHVMVIRYVCDKPLLEPVMTWFAVPNMYHLALLSPKINARLRLSFPRNVFWWYRQHLYKVFWAHNMFSWYLGITLYMSTMQTGTKYQMEPFISTS